jgi:hypothetical protein
MKKLFRVQITALVMSPLVHDSAVKHGNSTIGPVQAVKYAYEVAAEDAERAAEKALLRHYRRCSTTCRPFSVTLIEHLY